MGARLRWQKCVGLMSLYEAPDDAYMTVRAMPRGKLAWLRNPAAVTPYLRGAQGHPDFPNDINRRRVGAGGPGADHAGRRPRAAAHLSRARQDDRGCRRNPPCPRSRAARWSRPPGRDDPWREFQSGGD